MTFEVVETFKHRNRTCVIVKHDIIGIGHNGYVSVTPRNCSSTKDFSRVIETENITYQGTLDRYDGINKHAVFLGFDTLHGWNDEVPESKTYASVRAKTIELADEMVDKGI